MSNITISSGGLAAEISTQGAELQLLTDAAGRDLLWHGDPAVWSGRAPILFPIVGMLAGGAYRLDGTVHQMPKHGFARHSSFAVVYQGEAAVTLRLEDSDDTRAVYPFAFRLDLAFSLAGATLTMLATVHNPGDTTLPFSFGFHPAFRWPLPYDQPRAAHRILFDQDEAAPIRRINGDGVLEPESYPTPVVGRMLTLRDALFVDDALIFDQLSSHRLLYGAPNGPQLEIAYDGLPDLGVWMKPGADYICIEPWHGMADPAGFNGDFRTKHGVVQVSPGASRSFEMRVSLLD